MTIHITRLPNITTTYTINSTYSTNATFTWSTDVASNPLALYDNARPGPSETTHGNNGTEAIVTGGVTV